MHTNPLPRLIVTLRRSFRTSEAALIALAIVVGSAAGLMAIFQSWIAHFFQGLFYGLDVGRLSAAESIAPLRLLALPAGGLMLAIISRATKRRARAPIDVVEANALHGGVIPVSDSLLVASQTLVSNAAGASVGLEAAYAQVGGGIASVVGRVLRLRRNDLRILVGAGAGAAIGAAFGAPFTGAFYAFEIVIGAYTPAAIAPVAAASLAAVLVVRTLAMPAYLFVFPSAKAILTIDYFVYAGLGIICAGLGIALMRAVTLLEKMVRNSSIPEAMRPVVGGLLLIPLAFMSPQTLSAGHGALHLDFTEQVTLGFLATVFVLKVAASAVSLGFGFRGGLFFASLFLGSLAGQIFAGVLAMVPGWSAPDPTDAALIGMAALAVAVVGGPMTMTMLVLETTHDFALTAVATTAGLCASTVVRGTFGFSFSTWRLHIRGEAIRSARDVGWLRTLTAGRMMRTGVSTADQKMTITTFRRSFPLGSTSSVVLTGDDGRYAGIVITAAAYGSDVEPEAAIATLSAARHVTLKPEQNVQSVMQTFDASQSDELAVVDAAGHILGSLTERFVHRRYTREIEKAQRDLFGE